METAVANEKYDTSQIFLPLHTTWTCFLDFHNDVSKLEFWSSCLASGGSLRCIKIHVLLHFLCNFLSLFKTPFTEIWHVLYYSL